MSRFECSTLLIAALCASHVLGFFPDGTNVQVWKCNESVGQKWSPANPNTHNVMSDGKCLDISEYSKANGANVQLYSCHDGDKTPGHNNQEFSFDASTGQLTADFNSKCVSVGLSPTLGSNVFMNTCTNADLSKWVYNSADSSYRPAAAPSLCLDAGSTLSCATPPLSAYPLCNTSLPVAARVADLVARMSQAEKIAQLGNTAGPAPSVGVPAYQWWNEGLHGVAGSPGVHFVQPTPVATSFPQVIGMGATFNTSLFRAVGAAVSTEARAFHNAGNAGLTYWTPNINIFRDPRWGRGMETPGEDPFLTGRYVATYVRAMQEGEDPRYLKVVATCKHFDAYSLENWHGVTRYEFNAVVNDRDLVETYLPAFDACVNEGRAASIMCSYNAVNGVPSCANSFLQTEIVREQWGWNGYFVSDCGAIDDVWSAHHYTDSAQAAVGASMSAGCDLNCGHMFQDHAQEAIGNRTMSEATMDASLTRLFTARMELGMFDPPQATPYNAIPPSAVNTHAHQQLALEAAQQSITLLQNEGSALPLSPSPSLRVAMIGPHANATKAMQANYAGIAPYLISPLQGVAAYGVETTLDMGCSIAGNDTSGFAAATAAAAAADAVVVVLGLDLTQESEGLDRDSIALPGVQAQLMAAVYAAAQGKKPVIAVIMCGGPVDLTPVKSTADAILWVGYPGQSGGTAIADVLFGTVNPGGRLPTTVYPADYVTEIAMTNMAMDDAPGRTYRYYTGPAVYEFGFGLSYTSFAYKWANPTAASPASASANSSSSSSDSDAVSELPPLSLSTDRLLAMHRRMRRRQRRQHALGRSRSQPQQQQEEAGADAGEEMFVSGLSLPFEAASFEVTVTNTGKRRGDDVPMAFATSSQAGQPRKQLFGFQRVTLDPGAYTTVFFAISPLTLSTVTADGQRQLVAGTHTLTCGSLTRTVHVTGPTRTLFQWKSPQLQQQQ